MKGTDSGKEVQNGVFIWQPPGGLDDWMTWHHLDCFSFSFALIAPSLPKCQASFGNCSTMTPIQANWLKFNRGSVNFGD